MKLKFDTKNQTFRDIMAGGTLFEVPKFQRDYAWDQDQWEDLWNDIESTEDDDQHYMGYLVLQEKEESKAVVIDGQQRITTITLLVLAGLQFIKKLIEDGISVEDNTKRLSTLKSQYIGYTDPVSLQELPRLTLNRNNNNYFSSYLCTLEENPPIRRTKYSEKLLNKAKAFFYKKITEKHFKSGDEIADFLSKVSNKLLFTLITVGSDLNAYKVFETLNARGVQLSVPDLVKNYLFSVIDDRESLHENRIIDLENRWAHITSQLGKLDFARFINAEWNSLNPIVPKNILFKTIRNKIDNADKSFEYLRRLEKASEIYAALQDPDDEFWDRDTYRDSKTPLKTLSMFNITQPHGLLISAYQNFNAERFVKILKAIETISIRYNIVGGNPSNKQEQVYNRSARRISSKEITNVQGVKNALREIYISDDEFKSSFLRKHMKTAHSDKKARYLLARLEEQANGNNHCADGSLSLEHILPQNPSPEWLNSWDVEAVEKCIDVIGNMTLLTREENRQLGNASFEEKKEIFSKSNLEITKQIYQYDDWNEDTLNERQNWLADLACSKWLIQFE